MEWNAAERVKPFRAQSSSEPHAASLSAALEAWRHVLGSDFVLTGESCVRYGDCTVASRRRIPAVLRPRNEMQVREVMKIAARTNIRVYPISTGHNWGYGSANPVIDDCVVVDLSLMSAILDFDADLGTAKLQPGVTQQLLFEYLDRNKLPYLVPVTGAGPNCSLVGNALERGYGITPYADHFGAVVSLRAVLPNGDVYQSPLTETVGSSMRQTYKWGIGPYLDGLFSQGAFGIVTEMTIMLAPRPERAAVLFFEIRDRARLERVVTVVRDLMQSLPGHIGGINLLNQIRVLSMMERFPATEVVPGEAMPPALIEAIGRRRNIPAWVGVGSIYGTRTMWRGLCRQIRRKLEPHCSRMTLFTGERIALLQHAAALLPGRLGRDARGRLKTLSGAYDLVTGRPSETALPLAYWRSGQRPTVGPLDPARDGCGLVWYAPLVPMTGSAVRGYVAMVEEICPRFGMDAPITLTTLSSRCFDSTVPLLFDRDKDRERAVACYRALWQRGRELGFLPYRLNIDAMADLTKCDDSVFWGLVGTLQRAVDPKRIMAPGRYTPMRSADG